MGKMMHRYYTTQRPLAPGAIPRLRIPVDFEAWPERQYVPEIDRIAWGWVEYRETLTPEEISDFELVSEPREDG